jgi:hypothetical protein
MATSQTRADKRVKKSFVLRDGVSIELMSGHVKVLFINKVFLI